MLDHDLSILLASLFNAGWEVYIPKQHRVDPTTLHSALLDADIAHLMLRRTCLVLGITYNVTADELHFMPIVSTLPHTTTGGIDLFDAVTRTQAIKPSLHGLVPLLVNAEAARLGLLDPTRFTLGDDQKRMTDSAFLRSLYAQVIARDTADWLDSTLTVARKRIDVDDTALEAIRTALYQAPDVLPDPVPMAASIGITLQCWRNTEIEQLHAEGKLGDVIMAKLNITTTRKIRSFVTTSSGIDWPSVAGLLLDPERPAPNNTTIRDCIGAEWPKLVASIEQQLEHWQHVESVVGPRATLRLLSALGSTDYTKRWWGNSWWPTFAEGVLDHVQERFSKLLPEPVDEFSGSDLCYDVEYQPDELPDEVLRVLIDPPDGKGLRFAKMPEQYVHVLEAPQ